MSGLYILGIITGILAAFLYKGTLFRGEAVPFVMELPNYRLPGLKNVAQLLWEKARDFLQKAFTVILVAVFEPLGLGDWRICTSFITGFIAKESVVSTFEILFEGDIHSQLTAASAVSMLVFSLLYTPCVAAIASVRRELGVRWAGAVVVWQCVLAWIAAFAFRVIIMAFGGI